MTSSSKAPHFHWLTDRSAGLLLHPSSLPGPYGIGTLGRFAHQLLEVLAAADIRYWQVLPLGPTGFGDSPYTSFSSFAGNPLLIDLEALLDTGLLSHEDVEPLRNLPEGHCDFGALYQRKWPILRLAYRRFQKKDLAYIPNLGLFEDFCREQASWLDGYALFMALKDRFGGKPWYDWPPQWKSYSQACRQPVNEELKTAVKSYSFFQYIFHGQWKLLRKKAQSLGIEIIGDIPIYVALDSADTWTEPEVFELDAEGHPLAVAGVPPDYFSKTGQLWGNPLYNWKALEKTNFDWWMRRLAIQFALFDVIRLDHFRGFYDYWAVPAEAPDAREGQWRQGPQEAFFQAVLERFGPEVRIIAEDLGELSNDVHAFLQRLGLPGMSILQFAFDGKDSTNLFLPHMTARNSVGYAGTHDNDTVLGWYQQQPAVICDQIRRYFRVRGDDISWDFIRALYASVSRMAVVQAQDLFSLGQEARMNLPGTAQGNWKWRMLPSHLAKFKTTHAAYLKELAWLYGRSVSMTVQD